MAELSEPNKAMTLPRTKRDKSPSPSFVSVRTVASDTFSSLKNMKLMRKKKKKKVQMENSVESVESAEQEDSLAEQESTQPMATSTPEMNVAALDSSGMGKKKRRKPINKLVKGGKAMLQKIAGKNESEPIWVETTNTDMRRTGRVGVDDEVANPETLSDQEELAEEEAVVETVEATVATDVWATTVVTEKVKKLSEISIQSVYTEEEPSPTKDENTKSTASTPEEVFASNGTLDTESSFTFERKSPAAIRREILSITTQRARKVSEVASLNGSTVAKRKISLQAKNSTDTNEMLFKILVIGELGTGKTSIIKRYVHQFFSQHYRATIGVDFALKVLAWDDDTTIRLQLWDIAGQERFGNMTRVYYKEAVGAFVVFDVTRVATFEAVTKWKQDLDAKVQLPDGESVPCILLANKCDQPKEGIVNNQHKMDEFCKENNFLGWFETSAKENINIDEAAQSLVSQIVQNDRKRRQQEKEATNGVGVVSLNKEKDEVDGKKKICNSC